MKKVEELDPSAKMRKLSRIFFSLVVKSQLHCPRELFGLTIASFWIGFFQISSTLVTFSNKENSMESISWNEGWKILVYFTRPVQYIYQEYHSNGQAFNSAALVFIAIFLVTQIALFIIGGIFIETTKHRRLGYYLLDFFVNLSAFFNSILCIIASETLLFLLFHGTLLNEDKLTSDSQKLSSTNKSINAVIAGILLVLLQGYSFVCSKFFEISYSLQEKGIQKYSQDSLSVILNHLRVGAIIGYTYDPTASGNGLIITTCFCSGYFLAVFYEFFAKKPYSNQTKIEQYLVSLVLNILFVLFMILNKVANVTSNALSIGFLLILPPICLKVCLDFAHNYGDHYMYTNMLEDTEFGSHSEESISRKIAMLYNNQQRITTKDSLKFLGLYENHRQYCKRQVCFCKHSASRCNEDSVFLMNTDILNRYIRYLIRLELSSQNLNEHIDRLIFFVRYLTNLSQQKRHSFAISKIIEFISETDRMRKKHGTQVKVCIDTVLNLLKQMMYYNIGLIIIDDEVEAQLGDIDLYIRMDREKTVLKDIINWCITKRIEIFEKMKKNFEDFTELEKFNAEYNGYIDVLEARFKKFYDTFPSSQNQKFFIFFEAEIKGNLKRASIITKQRKFLQTANPKKLFNIFSPNVFHLTVTIGKIWGKIINFSDKLPGALGYKRQEFNYINHIKDLMAPTIANIHDELIRCMMTQGNDAIVNNQRQIFVKHKSNILVRVKVFIGMNLYFLEELPFGVFVTPIQTRSGFLFITNQGNIEGMDFGLLNIVGYSNVSLLPPFFQIKVQNVLPEFDEYSHHMEENNLTYYDLFDVPFYFFSKSHPIYAKIFNFKNLQAKELMRQMSQQSSRGISSELDSIYRTSTKRLKSSQSSQQHLIKFKADITIERHSIRMMDSAYIYFVVEVKFLVKINNSNNDEFTTIQTINRSQMNQISKRIIPISRNSIYSYKKPAETSIKSQESISDIVSIKVTKPALPTLNLIQETYSNRILDTENNIRYETRQRIPNLFPHLAGVIQQEYSEITERTDINSKVNETQAQSAIREELNLNYVHDTEGQVANMNRDLLGKEQLETFELNYKDEIFKEEMTNILDQSTQNNNKFIHNPYVDTSQLGTQDVSFILSKKEDTNFANNDLGGNYQGLIGASRFLQVKGVNSTSKIEEISQFQFQEAVDKDLHEELPKSPKKEKKKKHQKASETEEQKMDLKEKMLKEEREGSVCDYGESLTRSIEKYNYYEEFISSTTQPFHLKMVKIGRLIEYLILLAATIAGILTLYTSFDDLLKNIDSITMPSNILHPYANAYSISNARYLLYSNPSATLLANNEVILKTRLEGQFNIYQNTIVEGWQNSYLTGYFINTHIDNFNAYQIIGLQNKDTNTLLQSSAHLLYALGQVQNYPQADVLQQSYLPERSFMASNFQEFLRFFRVEAASAFDTAESYNDDLISSIVVQTIILNIVAIIIFCVSGWNFYQFSKILISLLKMCQTATTISVEVEMRHFKQLQEDLAESEDLLFSYNFSMQDIETQLIEANTFLERQGSIEMRNAKPQKTNKTNTNGGSILKRKKLLVNVQHEAISYWRFGLFGALCYTLFIIFTLSTYFLNTNFLNTFSPALSYYKTVSDNIQNISQLLALRSLLNEQSWLNADPNHSSSTQYLNVDAALLKQFYNQGQQSLLMFNQNLLYFNRLDFFTSAFKTELNDLVNSNICSFSDDHLDDTWDSLHCQKIFSGVLTQGLQNSISTWYDIFNSFQLLGYTETLSGQDLFLARLDQVFLSLMMTNFTTILRDKIQVNLSSNTQSQKNLTLLISVIFISIITVLYIYELWLGSKIIQRRFDMAKKIIYLVPLQTAMIEDTFIKILKAQSIRLEIIG